MASYVKPCIGLDGEYRLIVRRKGGSTAFKSRSRRNDILRAGRQINGYALVAYIRNRTICAAGASA